MPANLISRHRRIWSAGTSQGLITCVPKVDAGSSRLRCWIKELTPRILGLAIGSTLRGIYKALSPVRSVFVASREIREQREARAGSSAGLFTANSIRKNGATGDLLLPKLISGKIPVEAADEAAAQRMEATA